MKANSLWSRSYHFPPLGVAKENKNGIFEILVPSEILWYHF